MLYSCTLDRHLYIYMYIYVHTRPNSQSILSENLLGKSKQQYRTMRVQNTLMFLFPLRFSGIVLVDFRPKLGKCHSFFAIIHSHTHTHMHLHYTLSIYFGFSTNFLYVRCAIVTNDVFRLFAFACSLFCFLHVLSAVDFSVCISILSCSNELEPRWVMCSYYSFNR